MVKNKPTILLIDDEPKICQIIADILCLKGYDVSEAYNGEEGLRRIRANDIDLVLLDLKLPGISGMEILKKILKEHSEIPVIMISAHGTIQTAVESIKLGAYDFIEKPLDADRLLIVVRNALEKRNLTLKTRRLQEDVLERYRMVGESAAIKKIFQQIDLLAPTDANVLITGESGTGKELVAQALHNLSPRFGYPLVKINCAAIPESLLESELFGYEKGAFTGANALKKGRVELAQHGSLFLDEIGEINFNQQAKLLRLVEQKEFMRLGSTIVLKIDFRLITATNMDLEKEVRAKSFREVLYYRLNSIRIHIPPLRERKEDIPLLAANFLKQVSEEHNMPPKKLAPDVLQQMRLRDWPGNIRELKNYIYGLFVFAGDKEVIDLETYRLREVESIARMDTESGMKRAKFDFEREFILRILDKANWNVSRAARLLGYDRSYLHQKMKRLDITRE